MNINSKITSHWRTLILEIAGSIATITLNRPQRLNAIDAVMFEELETCFDRLSQQKDVRVVVITGQGRAFSSGADLVAILEQLDMSNPFAVRDYLRRANRVTLKMVNMEKPVIAAVNGPAIGGGCNLALAADLVIASETAVFSQAYTRRALVPDMGGMYFLPRLVGMAKAKELVLLGEEIGAKEAERIGLIARCVPPDQLMATVKAISQRLACSPAKALALAKTGLNRSLGMEMDAVLEYEAQAISLCFQTFDFKEALSAFSEKREPKYKGE